MPRRVSVSRGKIEKRTGPPFFSQTFFDARQLVQKRLSRGRSVMSEIIIIMGSAVPIALPSSFKKVIDVIIRMYARVNAKFGSQILIGFRNANKVHEPLYLSVLKAW